MHIFSNKIVTTRKRHICNACGRFFNKGSKMRTQVNNFEGEMFTWRECPTCIELLSTYRSYFEDDDHLCYEFCVNEILEHGQTPEDLLIVLSNNK